LIDRFLASEVARERGVAVTGPEWRGRSAVR